MLDPIRIIAWGNKGRSDDGVAMVLAERLERKLADNPAVTVQQFHQLAPELVCDLDRCRFAIFLDAHVRADWDDVTVERVLPGGGAALNTHHCSPAELLSLAGTLGYRTPDALLVCIRGYNMEFGDSLSEATSRAMLRAEQHVLGAIEAVLAGRTLEVTSHA